LNVVTKHIIRAVVAILAIGIVVLSALEAWRSITDFPQYYAAAKMYISGDGAQVYDEKAISWVEHTHFPKMKDEPVRFCFPPFSLPLFLPVGLPPPQIAHYAWTALSVLAFCLSSFTLRKTFNIPFDRAFWFVVLLPIMGPFCQSIIMGQPSFFLLLGLAGATFALKRGHPYWAALSMVALIPKPHLALPFCIFLLGARKFKTVFALAGIGAILLAVTLFTPGMDAYANYAAFMKYANMHPEVMNLPGCVTVRTQLLRFFPQYYDAIGIVSLGVFAGGLAFLAWLGNRYKSRQDWLEIASLVTMPVGFVTTLYVHPYDLLLFLPSTFVFGYVLKNRMPTRPLMIPLCLLMAVIFVFPIYVPAYFTKWPFYPLFWVVLGYAVLCVWNALRVEPETDKEKSENAA
jgi:hypothetical protein